MDSWVAKYWHKLFSEKEQQAKYCHPHGPPSSTNKPTSQVLPPPPQPNTLRKTRAETTHRPACAKIPPLPPPFALSIWKWVTRGSFFVSLSSFILLALSSFTTADEAAVMSELLTALNPAPSGWSASTGPLHRAYTPPSLLCVWVFATSKVKLIFLLSS
ncbi:hypothetical protein FH972_002097 [Carpinus fangiana]|uniref:Uncharacterized protein n=1 Tax=Carpinus fangiana TaxID=176857 RepID=A0A5N6QG70_9ROSI|nr:hypothetical protein FH972_002097 [Carpinus fangiana]